MDQYISYREAQHLTSLGKTKLREIVNSGDVEVARVGRAVRIRKASLIAYMERAASHR